MADPLFQPVLGSPAFTAGDTDAASVSTTGLGAFAGKDGGPTKGVFFVPPTDPVGPQPIPRTFHSANAAVGIADAAIEGVGVYHNEKMKEELEIVGARFNQGKIGTADANGQVTAILRKHAAAMPGKATEFRATANLYKNLYGIGGGSGSGSGGNIHDARAKAQADYVRKVEGVRLGLGLESNDHGMTVAAEVIKQQTRLAQIEDQAKIIKAGGIQGLDPDSHKAFFTNSVIENHSANLLKIDTLMSQISELSQQPNMVSHLDRDNMINQVTNVLNASKVAVERMFTAGVANGSFRQMGMTPALEELIKEKTIGQYDALLQLVSTESGKDAYTNLVASVKSANETMQNTLRLTHPILNLINGSGGSGGQIGQQALLFGAGITDVTIGPKVREAYEHLLSDENLTKMNDQVKQLILGDTTLANYAKKDPASAKFIASLFRGSVEDIMRTADGKPIPPEGQTGFEVLLNSLNIEGSGDSEKVLFQALEHDNFDATWSGLNENNKQGVVSRIDGVLRGTPSIPGLFQQINTLEQQINSSLGAKLFDATIVEQSGMYQAQLNFDPATVERIAIGTMDDTGVTGTGLGFAQSNRFELEGLVERLNRYLNGLNTITATGYKHLVSIQTGDE